MMKYAVCCNSGVAIEKSPDGQEQQQWGLAPKVTFYGWANYVNVVHVLSDCCTVDKQVVPIVI